MASIQQDLHSGIYRIRFRFAGRSYNRSLKTTNLKAARAVLGRIEENLQLIEKGRLEVPPKPDIAKFILSDGKIHGQPLCTSTTLGKPFESYQAQLPAGAKEELTVRLEKTQVNNFKQILPISKLANTITTADLQRYVERRLKSNCKGRKISPETVKREMATFRSIFNWAKSVGLVEGESPTNGLIINLLL